MYPEIRSSSHLRWSGVVHPLRLSFLDLDLDIDRAGMLHYEKEEVNPVNVSPTDTL